MIISLLFLLPVDIEVHKVTHQDKARAVYEAALQNSLQPRNNEVDDTIKLIDRLDFGPAYVVESWIDHETGTKFIVIIGLTGEGAVSISDPTIGDGEWFGWQFAPERFYQRRELPAR